MAIDSFPLVVSNSEKGKILKTDQIGIFRSKQRKCLFIVSPITNKL